MPVDARLVDLVELFEDAREQGRRLTAEELCRDCPELLDGLKQVLAGLGRLDSILDVSAATQTFAADSWIGADAESEAGRYQRLRLHARGGLGEVFVALDTELRREVALKRMQSRFRADPYSCRRFLQEAEITGRLEHPGVVPVYGLRLDADRQPCYAMRLVRGRTLHEAIRELHESDRPGNASERRLALRQLLTRFLAVCNTIAYAHSQGILHRDLKPANIMLGPYGETLVLDWGLAKLLGATDPECPVAAEASPPGAANLDSATRMGQVVGTPGYMSPEQAAGQWDRVGPASDIFSLGAVLYTILSGRAPSAAGGMHLDARGFGHIRRFYGSSVRALEAICRRALAVEPQARYASAQALAADVEHWLADEPVTAWREPAAERAWRWLRGHRPAVAGIAGLFVATLLALLVVNALTTQHATELEAEREETQKAFRQMSAINGFLKQKFLATARPRAQDGGLGKDVTIWLALNQAAPEIARVFADQPEIEADLRDTFGLTYYYLGHHLEAQEHLERALELRRRVLGPEHRDTLTTQNNLGLVLSSLGKLVEAEKLFRDALASRRRILGSDHPQTLRSLSNLGSLLRERRQPGEAEKLLEEALAARRRILGPEHPDTLQSQNDFAEMLRSKEKTAEAESLHRRTLEARIRVRGPEHPETLESQNNLADLLWDHGSIEEAESLWRKSLQAAPRVLGPDHRTTVEIRTSLASLLHEQERPAEAEPLLRESLAVLRRARWATAMDLADGLSQLGEILVVRCSHAEAEAMLRESLTLRETKGPADWKRYDTQSLLGESLLAQGKLLAAEPALVSGFEGMHTRTEVIPADSRDRLSMAGERILRLYRAWGKKEQLVHWQKRLQRK